MYKPIHPGNTYYFEFNYRAPDAAGKRGQPLTGQVLTAHLSLTDGGALIDPTLRVAGLPEYVDTRPAVYHGAFAGSATEQLASMAKVFMVVTDAGGNVKASDPIAIKTPRRVG